MSIDCILNRTNVDTKKVGERMSNLGNVDKKKSRKVKNVCRYNQSRVVQKFQSEKEENKLQDVA